MVAKGQQNVKGCDRGYLGEIDTSSPFLSVKDAVMIFGNHTSSGGRCMINKLNSPSAEIRLVKETKLGFAQKELNKLKEKIKKAETAKAEALLELEKAKKTAGDLSDKLKAVNECRDIAVRAVEGAKSQVKHYEQADSLSSADQMQDLVRAVTSELDGAKESIQKVAEEENALRRLVDSMKLELEIARKEHEEFKAKEAGTEAIARDLHAQIQKAKIDLESKLSNGFEDARSKTLQKLSSETENARREAEEIKAKAEDLKRQAKDVRIALERVEEELRVALLEAEEGNAAEESSVQCINSMFERTDTAHNLVLGSNARITISMEEFESLSSAVEDYEKLAEIKVAAALAEVETIKACENEALKKLEMRLREIQDIKAATMEASKKAAMAEEAKKAAESEFKWHEREQKKAVEISSRVLTETKKSVRSSTHHSKILKQTSGEKFVGAYKLDKAKSCVSKNVLLPGVSRIFQSRKNHDNFRSFSCLPN